MQGVNRSGFGSLGALAVIALVVLLGGAGTQPMERMSAQATNPAIVVDHTSVALFDRIPEEFISAAASWRVVWWNKSVGALLDDGLTKLMQADPRFNRANWKYFSWPATGCGGWYDLLGCFYAQAGPVLDQYELLSYQTSYLEVGLGSTVLRYFDDTAALNEIGDYTKWQEDRGRRAMYWTSSLSRDAGSAESTAFNATMREYVRLHGGILFDMADLLSFAPDGAPCYDNRDGVYYVQPNTNPPKEENYPDDGYNYPAICGNNVYTVETFGGHLNRDAKERLAKAYWVLMAQVAGWIPEGEPPEPSPEPSAIPSATATSILQSPLPSPTPLPAETPVPSATACSCEPCPCVETPTVSATTPITPEATISATAPPTAIPEPQQTATGQPTAIPMPTATPIPEPSPPTATAIPMPTATAIADPVPEAEKEARTIAAALELWKRATELANMATDYGRIPPVSPQRVSQMATEWWTCAEVFRGECPR